MKAPTKKRPKFKSEDAERAFWAKADATDYFPAASARAVEFPNLKPSTETISLRLPKGLLERIKSLANQRDMPYQSLMKYMLSEKVQEATPPYRAP